MNFNYLMNKFSVLIEVALKPEDLKFTLIHILCWNVLYPICSSCVDPHGSDSSQVRKRELLY